MINDIIIFIWAPNYRNIKTKVISFISCRAGLRYFLYKNIPDLRISKAFLCIIYNLIQNLWNNVKKSSKIRQKQKSQIAAFV